MNETTKTKAINLEDLQLSVQDIYNRGGFGNVGTCNTAAATAAKAVTLGTIFSLSTGCVLLIKFTNGIESENSTLAITHTTLAGTTVTEDAKPIYLEGAALKADVIQEGAILILRYNGTQFDIIGGAGSGNEVEIGDTAPTGDPKIFVDESEDPSDSDLLDFYTQEETDAMIANTVHVSAQTITEAQKTQARTNIGAQKIIANASELGFGLATCATAGNVQAKEVSITNFVLKENAFVSVLFANGFMVSNPTLNISNTGAKPIYFQGSAIDPARIEPNTIVSMVYDGTNYEVVNIEKKGFSSDEWVDLGLPSGTLWCRHNVGGVYPEDFGYYFSQGNVDGHTPNDGYNFGNSDSGPYASTPGASIPNDGNIAVGVTYDAARKNLGSPWRLPTTDEVTELIANTTSIDTYLNSRRGRQFTGSNGNSIFIPYAGYIYETYQLNQGSILRVTTSKKGTTLLAEPSVSPSLMAFGGFIGIPVRAVQ